MEHSPRNFPKAALSLGTIALDTLAIGALLVMMLHIVANAVLRWAMSNPIPNTLELTQFWYMPIIAMLGVISAQVRGQHIAVDLIYEKLTRGGQRFIFRLGFILGALIFLGFTWYGYEEAIHSYDIQETGGISNVPIWPVKMAIPIFSLVMAALFVFGLYRETLSRKSISP